MHCGQEGCPRLFENFRYLRRHLERHHTHLLSADEENDYGASSTSQSLDASDNLMDSGCSDDVMNENEEVHGNTYHVDLTASFMLLLGQLESKANVTGANIQTVVENFQVFMEDVSQYCTEKVTSMLSQLHVSSTSAAAESCLNDLTSLCEIITPVSSKHKRTQYLQKCGVLIEPEELVLSTRNEFRYAASSGFHVPKVVEDTMQYVPLEKLLGALLLNQKYKKIMTPFQDISRCARNEVINHYFDTSAFKNHPFFQKFPDSLALNLYVDAFETTNVLGSHTGVHKLEAMYMSIQNCAPSFQSRLSCIFLVALWYAQDAKTYGYDKILETIVKSLLQLESDDGVSVCIKNQKITVRACLVFLSADNLGFNSLFGFCESFSATHFCRFCECTRDQADCVFKECALQLRSKSSYDDAVSKVGTPLYDVHVTGIKRGCLLNMLQYWHVTDNLVVDVMHDILEGIAPFELTLIFNELVRDGQCSFSLDRLNSSITAFDFSVADKNSRPSALSSLDAMKMSASEMWCFVRNLPLLIGFSVPREQPHWNLLLMLLDIMDIVFAPALTESLVHFLSHLVEEHHSYFREIFPEKRLLPKHHFLVHYAKCMQMSGPPVRYWSMRFEARHQIFKEMARTTHCFRNICKTLAKRFQHRVAFQLLNPTLNIECESGPSTEVMMADFTETVCNTICNATSLCHADTVYVTSWVTVGHYVFKPNVIAVHAINDGIPQFGVVTDIVALDRKFYFVLDLLETLHYDGHFHAYVVKRLSAPNYAFVSVNNLKDHIPLQSHTLCYEGVQNTFISLRYALF